MASGHNTIINCTDHSVYRTYQGQKSLDGCTIIKQSDQYD